MKTTITYSKHLKRDGVIIAVIAVMAIIITVLAISGITLPTIEILLCLLLIAGGALYLLGRTRLLKNFTPKYAMTKEEKMQHTWRPQQSYTDDEMPELTEIKPSVKDEIVEKDETYSNESTFRRFKLDVLKLDANADIQADEAILFRYQCGYFQVSMLNEDIVRLTFPRIFTSSVVLQDLLCRTINNVNGSYALCKLCAMPSSVNADIDVHAYADFPYSGPAENRLNMLKNILAVFFEMQRSLLVTMTVGQSLEQVQDLPSPEEYTGSYKDISLN